MRWRREFCCQWVSWWRWRWGRGDGRGRGGWDVGLGSSGCGFLREVLEDWVLGGYLWLACYWSVVQDGIKTYRFFLWIDGPGEGVYLVEDPDCFFAEWLADLCDWGCEDCSVFDRGLEADVGFVAEEGCEDLFAELVGEGEQGDGHGCCVGENDLSPGTL